MSLITKRILHCSSPLSNITKYSILSISASQIRSYAARKGTREKKKKLKVKVEEKKVAFVPHNLRDKEKLSASRPKRKFDDSWKGFPVDDVYSYKHYQWKVYPFGEAVGAHRETHHPEMYNQPNADLRVTIELNMEGEKKTRFLDNIHRIAPIPHRFDHGEDRTIIAFSKTPEAQEEARTAGAQLAGGVELIKEVQSGALSLQDFEFVVAHPNILAELVVLRGLMKKKFPNVKNGSLDVNLAETIGKFLYGISYAGIKDEYEKDFGSINTVIGTLNMEAKCLEENFAALVRDVYEVRPKRAGPFLSRCLLWTSISSERLKVDHNLYIDLKSNKRDVIEDDDEEQAAVSV